MVPFIIKDEAVEQIRTIYDRMEKKKPNASVRLIITILSIAYGPEWAFTLDEYSPEIDECCDFDGLRVIIERSLLEATGGLTIEYEADKDDPESGNFVIIPADHDVDEFISKYGYYFTQIPWDFSRCGSSGGCGGCGSCGGCGGCGDGECDGNCDCCSHDDAKE